MPDSRTHRGAHPKDRELFAPEVLDTLRRATAELSWLLDRGYAQPSSLKLVGDRYQLAERQRMAVMRSAAGEGAVRARAERRLEQGELRGRRLVVDGFNVLMTVESALGGGVVLRGRDGCLRDLASVHGSYRKVEETEPAARFIGVLLEELGTSSARWLLDQPVSNSGRLRALLGELASAAGWPWTVELVFAPDPILAAGPEAAATSDGAILDRAPAWAPLSSWVVERFAPDAWVVDLGGG